MSEAETQSDDTDNDDAEEEQFEYHPQVTQHPTTAIEGEIVDLVTGSDISSDVEDTGSSFGVVYEDPEVASGTLWKNRNIPDGFETTAEYNDTIRMALANENDTNYVRGTEVTDENVEDAQERLADEGVEVDPESDEYDDLKVSGTDYKVADPSDRDAEVQEVDDSVLGIDVGGGVFSSEEAEEFGADKIMVWYGGMSGQFVGRGLDFNGMPFARYNVDDGVYLVKGLFQVPIGWRGDSDVEDYGEVPTTDRSKLATDYGRPPRTARPPILRDDIDGRAFVAIGRYNGGDGHEAHIGRAIDDYDDLIEALRNDDLDKDDDNYDALDMKYDQSPEETLNAAFDNPSEVFNLYHGEGWQEEHEDADFESSGAGGSFDIDVDNEEVEHPTDNERAFAENVVEKLTGTGMSPDDDIFPVDDGKADLEGLVEHNEDNFAVDPDVDSIREIVDANL